MIQATIQSLLLNQFITILGTAIILFILHIVCQKLIPAYASEKGKNLATKQDIGEITQIVESIKMDNSKQLENVKSELDFILKVQFSVYDDERKSIVELISLITEFSNKILDFPVHYDFMDVDSKFERKIDYVESEMCKIFISHQKLVLFCHDDEIIDLSRPVVDTLNKIKEESHFFLLNILALKKQRSELNNQYISAPTSKLKNSMNKISKEDLDLHKRYTSEAEILFENFHKHYVALMLACKKYLKPRKEIS